jgi:hypothetical protein
MMKHMTVKALSQRSSQRIDEIHVLIVTVILVMVTCEIVSGC